MREAGIAGNALGQPDAVGHRDVLEQFLRAFVGVEEPDLEVEHWLAGHAEEEVTRLDDARMHRSHRDLEHPFAFNFPELMPLALERRQHRMQVKVLAQRVHFRPVIVERAAARIGVAFKFEAEHVLYLTFLPIRSGQGIGQRNELRLFR